MPPYHITKQKVLHFSIFLGKEIKLKNEGGGNFSSWGKEYTPLLTIELRDVDKKSTIVTQG